MTKAPRANTVTHTGALASRAQIDELLDLRRQVGGLVVCLPDAPCELKPCAYHKQLGAFKDANGNPVRDADKLSPDQIANLIGRYKAKIAQQATRAAEPPDIGVLDQRASVGTGTVTSLKGHIARKTQSDDEFTFIEHEVCAVFGVDKLAELHESQAGSAMALVMAYGTDAWGQVLARVREKEATS